MKKASPAGSARRAASIASRIASRWRIEKAATPLAGYLHGFEINGAIMVASGVLGLLLLHPNAERARLAASGAPRPRLA